MDALIPVLFPVVTLYMFAVPSLLVPMRLPHRANFERRIAFGLVIMLVFFFVWQPGVDLGTQRVIPVEDFVSMAAFFAVTLAIMMLFVLLCFDVSILGACYCATVAYTVQNLGASTAELFNLITRDYLTIGQLHIMMRMAFACTIAYVLYYYLIVRRFPPEATIAEPKRTVFILFFVVILVSIVFDMGVKRLPGLKLDMSYLLLFRVTQIVMVAAILVLEYELLYSRSMQIQAAATERLMHDREAQYELSRDTIEAINIKMHDIRHQIRHLETEAGEQRFIDKSVLDDIAREVNLYDSRVKTGNEALDIILTEKTLLGEREHISLACIVDGEALSFMSDADLYALFGNAIENAFEAVRILNDTERRNISLLVRRVANMASIHIENYFDGRLLLDSDGKPVTSKGDTENHGFGIKSMRQICERYGGTLSLDASDSTFSVNMLIPIP